MRKSMRFATFAAMLVFAWASATAQELENGTWTISPSSDSAAVRLELHVESADGSNNGQSSDTVPIVQLGLNRAQLDSPGERAHFALHRDAGDFGFDGWLQQGSGSGHFTFTPSTRYSGEMRRRGYTVDSPRKLLGAALLDLSYAYIDSVAATGVGGLDFDNLVGFRALRIDAPYVRAMRSRFHEAGANDLLSLKALNVTDGYLSSMRSMGFETQTANDAVQLRALNVTPDYVREMASVGYGHLSTHELVELRALGIDAAFVRRAQAHGFRHLSVEQLVQAKAMGVL